MARRATEDPAVDARDTALLSALAQARVLSTAQLAQALPGERLGRLVERLKRLAIAGWLGCVAHVPSANGRVTVWFRSDLPPPGDRVAFGASVLPLGAIFAGLHHGPRRFDWALRPAEGPLAILEVPGHRRFLLAAVDDEEALLARCDALQRLPGDAGEAGQRALPVEVLLICREPALRERLCAVARAWRTRHPESTLAPHVTTGPDALRVLRTLVHGELLALSRPAPPVEGSALP